MRLLIVLAVLLTIASTDAKYWLTPLYEYRGPPAPLSNDGRVMETPEVRRARTAHMAAHATALARIKELERNDYDDKMMQLQMPPMKPAVRSVSIAPLSPDGRVVDTAEVAQAKAAHLAAHARAAQLAAAATASAPTQYRLDVYDGRRELLFLPLRINYAVSPVGYRGPPAPIGPDGHVVDTPEVVKARAAHMKAHAHALAMVSRESNYYSD